ncbi:MAG: hypothetical protein HZB53_14905 [Chloroflexi bacterium]|nr:hypothetical protein [Chloroflexota bacterium]
MKIVVIGTGLMGPASAYIAMSDPAVSEVGVFDMNQAQIDTCLRTLAGKPGANKLKSIVQDLRDEAASAAILAGYDAAVAALPAAATILAIRAAARARKPLIDLTWPMPDALSEAKKLLEASGTLYIPGCGVEPGLTEIMARYLAEKLDRVDELHIKCGGIPDKPEPPMGYKIVFGGKQMPLRDTDTQYVENGALKSVARYSGVEDVWFDGVGACEAWHEGFMPWLLELDALKNLRLGTQKTVRWPGYAAKATMLKELGLLSLNPVTVDGVQVAPKKVVDAVLYPKVRLAENERDITLFRVEACGAKNGAPCGYGLESVDRYDEKLGFTSMARTTAFTAAIVARMVARGEVKGRGVVTPEKLIAGAAFDRLVAELAAAGVTFSLTTEQTGAIA